MMRRRTEPKIENDAETMMCVPCQNGQHEECEDGDEYPCDCEECGHELWRCD